jgi:hypothetical protein
MVSDRTRPERRDEHGRRAVLSVWIFMLGRLAVRSPTIADCHPAG